MKHSSSLELQSALTAELSALQHFVAFLEREQLMLLESNSDPLFELSEQKSDYATQLNKLAQQRCLLLQQNLPELNAAAVHAFILEHCPQGLPMWEQTVALAEQAQRLNQTTGELIQMRLRHNQQLLAALSKAANKANLYGSNGRANFSPGSGRSLGSG